jgi:nuclear transcription Y subunit beta
MKEKRKTINGDDLIWSLGTLGFEYVDPLKLYREVFNSISL